MSTNGVKELKFELLLDLFCKRTHLKLILIIWKLIIYSWYILTTYIKGFKKNK